MTTDLINMDTLADLVCERGVAAIVQMSGGGCATLYTGAQDADGHRVLAVGPGVYKHREYGFSAASFEEFFIGDDGHWDEWTEVDNTPVPLEALADQIVAAHHATRARLTAETA